jgi:hypothetical protein
MGKGSKKKDKGKGGKASVKAQLIKKLGKERYKQLAKKCCAPKSPKCGKCPLLQEK